jgi:hypothetical protein
MTKITVAIVLIVGVIVGLAATLLDRRSDSSPAWLHRKGGGTW